MLSDKEDRANRDKAQAVKTRKLTDAILIADNAGAKLKSKIKETKQKMSVKGCGPVGTMDSNTAENVFIGMTTNLKELAK